MAIDFQPQGMKIELRGDCFGKDFQSFTLTHPPRLVIDFPGTSTSFRKKFLNLNHSLLKEIRSASTRTNSGWFWIFQRRTFLPIESFGRPAVCRSSSGRLKRSRRRLRNRRRRNLLSRLNPLKKSPSIPIKRSRLTLSRSISDEFSLSFPKRPGSRSFRAPRCKGPLPCA